MEKQNLDMFLKSIESNNVKNFAQLEDYIKNFKKNPLPKTRKELKLQKQNMIVMDDFVSFAKTSNNIYFLSADNFGSDKYLLEGDTICVLFNKRDILHLFDNSNLDELILSNNKLPSTERYPKELDYEWFLRIHHYNYNYIMIQVFTKI